MKQKFVQIDAFTDKPFSGNPAAVCLLKAPADPKWMQLIAREMNLSETAFLSPISDGYHLRWFTPSVEVPLCGHATLATAHLLFHGGHVPCNETIRFHTLSGVLEATTDGDWIYLDFPASHPSTMSASQPLRSILGDSMTAAATSPNGWNLAELVSEDAVRGLRPDFAAIAALPGGHLVVTAKASMPEVDFVSRCFAPGFGVNEDPVTGSAHTVLGPY